MNTIDMSKISIVLPAKNESGAVAKLVSELRSEFPAAEVIVVDDGSSDGTGDLAKKAGAHVVRHPVSMGNGSAVKTGAREAQGEIICFMDADGQHRPSDIKALLVKLNSGFDMVVGARRSESQASMLRGLGNRFYNWFASLMVGQKIEDLTSGMRVARANKFKEFLHLLPNKFSYPTTSTMAFFRSGYTVGYVPIVAEKRVGKSHLKLWKDGLRFLLIIFKIGTLYSPLKIFLPVAFLHFVIGVSYYLYTYIFFERFTNMSALLFTSSIMIFLMGLISEQITALTYSNKSK